MVVSKYRVKGTSKIYGLQQKKCTLNFLIEIIKQLPPEVRKVIFEIFYRGFRKIQPLKV